MQLIPPKLREAQGMSFCGLQQALAQNVQFALQELDFI